MESLFNKSPLTDEDRKLIAYNFAITVESTLRYAYELIDIDKLDPSVLNLPRKDRAMATLNWAIKSSVTFSSPENFEQATQSSPYQQSTAALMLANRASRRSQAMPPARPRSPENTPTPRSGHSDSQSRPGPVKDMAAFDAFMKSRPTPEAFKTRYPDVQLAFFGVGFTRTPGKDIYVASIDNEGRLGPGYFARRA